MQFFVVVATLLSVAFAASNEFVPVRRQSSQNGVAVNAAAMTDANGNVVAFDSNNVYLDMVAKGL